MDTLHIKGARNMPVASSFYGLGLFALVAVLLGGIAVTASARARTGSALAVLLVLVAVVYVVGILSNNQVVAGSDYLDRHPFAGLGTALAVAADLGLFIIAGLAMLLAAALARRWVWLTGIAAALLPMVALALAGMLPTSPSKYAQNVVPFTVALFCPVLVGLVYSLLWRRPQRLAGSSAS
jgi:hypothetical protein